MSDKILQSEKIMNKYPDKIPVIVRKFKNTDLPDINKSKYIVPKDMNFRNFVYIIRKNVKISSEKAIFITINGRLCPSNSTLGEIYDNMKNDDGFLYMEYSSENTFG
jgi:GABA(A) receptor-associated protein